MKEHQILRDHTTNRSRGFGFITFDSEQVVDELLAKGNRIDMAGTQVSVAVMMVVSTISVFDIPYYLKVKKVKHLFYLLSIFGQHLPTLSMGMLIAFFISTTTLNFHNHQFRNVLDITDMIVIFTKL